MCVPIGTAKDRKPTSSSWSSRHHPEGFELVVIPAGNYLEVTHEGPISNLAPSYGEAYGVVFPQSGADLRGGPHLELYDAMLNPNADDYKMGILIPVK